MNTEIARRRTVLKYVGGAAGAGAAAAAGLSSVARRASAQANVVFHDHEATLDVGGEVEDVAVSGRIEGEYSVPSGNADEAAFEVTLERQGPAEVTITDTIAVGGIDPSGDAVTVDPRYSLVEETSLSPSHFTPGPGERERTDTWEIGVRFAVSDEGGSTLCESEAGDEAVVAVRPHPDDDGDDEDEGAGDDEDEDAGDADGTVSGSFTFEVEAS